MSDGSSGALSGAMDVMPSPVGPLRLVAHGGALVRLAFTVVERPSPDGPVHPRDRLAGATGTPVSLADATPPDRAVLQAAREQLEAYFAGALRSFTLPLMARGTPFQQQVWTALEAIPFGVVISYAELARRVGNAQAMRAVGAANGRNPLAIVRPCHRVIGADGSLTGFGGGLPAKEWLLRHEGVLLA